MNRSDIEQFVRRDWEAIAASKRAYWAERFRTGGWKPAWDAANALFVQIRHAQPDYPRDGARDADLESHLNLRARLDRVAHAFTRR